MDTVGCNENSQPRLKAPTETLEATFANFKRNNIACSIEDLDNMLGAVEYSRKLAAVSSCCQLGHVLGCLIFNGFPQYAICILRHLDPCDLLKVCRLTDAKKKTILHFASEHGNPEVIKLVNEKLVAKEDWLQLLRTSDESGANVLDYAAPIGSPFNKHIVEAAFQGLNAMQQQVLLEESKELQKVASANDLIKIMEQANGSTETSSSNSEYARETIQDTFNQEADDCLLEDKDGFATTDSNHGNHATCVSANQLAELEKSLLKKYCNMGSQLIEKIRQQELQPLSEKVSELELRLEERDQMMADQEKKMADQEKKMADQEKKMADQEEKMAEHEKKMADQEQKMAEQEKKMAEQEQNMSSKEQKNANQAQKLNQKKEMLEDELNTPGQDQNKQKPEPKFREHKQNLRGQQNSSVNVPLEAKMVKIEGVVEKLQSCVDELVELGNRDRLEAMERSVNDCQQWHQIFHNIIGQEIGRDVNVEEAAANFASHQATLLDRINMVEQSVKDLKLKCKYIRDGEAESVENGMRTTLSPNTSTLDIPTDSRSSSISSSISRNTSLENILNPPSSPNMEGVQPGTTFTSI